MKLGEFIKEFTHNNIIRLHYKEGGKTILVADEWNETSMDWEVNEQRGRFRHYINNKVLGLVGIYGINGMDYPEAINIIIEKLDNQPFIDEINDDSVKNESTD